MTTQNRMTTFDEGHKEVEKVARQLLDELWAEIQEAPLDTLAEDPISAAISNVFNHKEIGWKYSILIQVTGKAVNYSYDALCLQKGEGHPGQWEPREFAKRVIVPWLTSIGEPFSRSDDPYVNNIFRRPRFDDTMRKGRRSQGMYDLVKGILDQVQASSNPLEVRHHLRRVLTEIRRYMQGKSFDYPIPQRIGLLHSLDCVKQYLDESSGGARLQAVAQGLVMALKSIGVHYEEIASRHVNAADAASQRAGDVECYAEGRNVLTIEVKDRELTIAELTASIEKARMANVRELLFFIHGKQPAAYGDADRTQIEGIVEREFALGLNIYIDKAEVLLRFACMLLGENGRREFLVAVGKSLEEQGADAKHRWEWSRAVRGIGAAASC